MLERDTVAVYAYGCAREAGEKHSVAITEAVAYVRAYDSQDAHFGGGSKANPVVLAIKTERNLPYR